MDIAAKRSAMAAALAATGLRVHPVIPDPVEINPPCLLIYGPTGRILDTQDGRVTRDWEIVLLWSSEQQSRSRFQTQLDPYLDEDGAQSVIAAVEDGQTVVTGWTDYGRIPVDVQYDGRELAFWGVRFFVRELA